MFLFLINAGFELNKDRLCKTMQKIFHSSKHKPYGSKLKLCRNIHGPERSLISCFYVDVRVVWSENVRFFLLRPSFKKSCWEGKRSLWFAGAIIFCQLLLDLPGFLFFEVSVASCRGGSRISKGRGGGGGWMADHIYWGVLEKMPWLKK